MLYIRLYIQFYILFYILFHVYLYILFHVLFYFLFSNLIYILFCILFFSTLKFILCTALYELRPLSSLSLWTCPGSWPWTWSSPLLWLFRGRSWCLIPNAVFKTKLKRRNCVIVFYVLILLFYPKFYPIFYCIFRFVSLFYCILCIFYILL